MGLRTASLHPARLTPVPHDFTLVPRSGPSKLTEFAGIDLDIVHALPHTPNEAELRMAEHYIKYIIWKDEATNRLDGPDA